jgi:hypothetical protein
LILRSLRSFAAISTAVFGFMRELAVYRRTVMRDLVEAEEGALAASITERTSVFSGRAVWIRVPFA